ncbi:MAG TPA: uroporphyrinogen decarboxylase family protein [Bryobacteraceae bacterium]|nr:uroporphyrinogen decarboxylase family protein [Bryobacteraceae bacterium]
MDREFYLELAASGFRAPIATDLALNEFAEPERILEDGRELGRVLEAAAARYGSRLAFPLMDLKLEKADLLAQIGMDAEQADVFHFDEAPSDKVFDQVRSRCSAPFSRRSQAQIDSVAHIAEHSELLPVGMAIGPFSLATKLMSDPITAVAMAGMGLAGSEDPTVLLAERCLALAEIAVRRSVAAQIRSGAKAMLICEPAANRVYLSPRQIQAGSDIFERFVMQPNLRLAALLRDSATDLIFHDCGELTTDMVRQFATRLDPAVLSLGSSRKLWEDAEVVPKRVVLYGNLPTKNFYSDDVLPVGAVVLMAKQIVDGMAKAGHPHILGSECDVLHMAEASETIRRKLDSVFL